MTDYKLPVEMALPCPFCGSSNIGNKYIETYSTDSSYDTFGCKDCGARFEDGCQDDWNRRAAPVERNQCDGCQAGIPVENGMHRMGKPDGYADLIACTADRYGAAPAVQGEPPLVVWVLYDATAEQKYIKASDDGALAIFDNEAAARRARTMHQGTDYKRCEYYTAPQPAEREIPGSYPVSGQIFFRGAGNEWVLELTGSVNGTTFTARHTQPADTRPEDVAGLPALYEPAPDVAGLVEALEGALNGRPLDTEFWDRCEQFIADHRKGGDTQ